MILYTLENKPHPNENNISLDWQKKNISEIGLEPSIRSQSIANLDS